MNNYQFSIIDKNKFNGTIGVIKANSEKEAREKIELKYTGFKIDKIVKLETK